MAWRAQSADFLNICPSNQFSIDNNLFEFWSDRYRRPQHQHQIGTHSTNSTVKSGKFSSLSRLTSESRIFQSSTDISTSTDIPHLVNRLKSPCLNVQATAAACLQHLVYKNNDAKEETWRAGGLICLMRLLESKDPVVVANATGVLRNLTSGSNIPLCKEFEKLGGIRAISGLLERLFQILTEDETGNRYMSRNDSDRLCASMENASAILCNISSLECMRSGNLLVSVVPSLVSAVLEPVAEAACCRLNSRNEDGAPPYSCALYRNCTAVIRNLSCSVDTDTRSLLRRCPGLLASLLTVMHVAGETGLADTKAVENCACAVRNLCFSLWATVEFAESGESVSNRSERVSNRTPKDMIPWETPTKVPETLLWHANAVACFLTLLRRASNPVCTEAAAGALRNLTSKANWRPAEIVRSEVRLQHGLPVLVDLLCVSNSAVVTTVAMALRNLCVERETLEVLGQQAIPVLVSCLSAVPETPRSRSLSSLRSLASSPRNRPQLTSHALAAILALCSTIILGHEKFASRFVELGGVQQCNYLLQTLRSEQVVTRQEYQNICGEAACRLLEALWKMKPLRQLYSKVGLTGADFLQKNTNRPKKMISAESRPSRVPLTLAQLHADFKNRRRMKRDQAHPHQNNERHQDIRRLPSAASSMCQLNRFSDNTIRLERGQSADRWRRLDAPLDPECSTKNFHNWFRAGDLHALRDNQEETMVNKPPTLPPRGRAQTRGTIPHLNTSSSRSLNRT